MIKGAHGLYNYLQAVQGYLAPPIFVVFFFGVFCQAPQRPGLPLGHDRRLRLGLFRMLVDTPVTLGLAGFENGYTPGSFLWIVNNIYFQYFSMLITIVSAIVMVVVSYMTAEPDYTTIQSLTFATATAEDNRARARAGAGPRWPRPARPGLHPRRLPLFQGLIANRRQDGPSGGP